jgi:hypothetical protein
MATALEVTIVIQPPSPLSSANGPQEVLAGLKTLLENNSYTVYTDGARAEFVAEPADEAIPVTPGME